MPNVPGAHSLSSSFVLVGEDANTTNNKPDTQEQTEAQATIQPYGLQKGMPLRMLESRFSASLKNLINKQEEKTPEDLKRISRLEATLELIAQRKAEREPTKPEFRESATHLSQKALRRHDAPTWHERVSSWVAETPDGPTHL